jgi:uncharacterized membrane protein YkoI
MSNNMMTIVVIIAAATMLVTANMMLTNFNPQVLAQANNTGPLKGHASGGLVANLSSPSSPNNQSMSTIMNNPQSTIGSINSSIAIGPTIENALSSKVKFPLSEASVIAQKAVGSNSTTTMAFLHPLNGYLVYDLHVKNKNDHFVYAVIVDPGNGKILYKRALPFIFSGLGTVPFYRGGCGGCR